MNDLTPGGGAAPGPAAPTWLVQLGPLARRRPPPSLGRALAGAGGALVGAGMVTMAGDHWAATGSSALAVPLTAAVLVAGVAATVRATPAPVAAAGVAAAGFAAPAVAFFVSAGSGFPSLREVALLAGLLLGGLYLVGPWRGHTFHLAVLVTAGWLFAVSLADLGPGGGLIGGFDTLGDAVAEAGVASMAVGGLYLAAGRWLHQAGLEGMATPLLGVGCAALPVGALAIAQDGGDLAGGVVVAAAGAAAAAVGGLCGRRGTVWIGVGLAAAGAVVVVRDLAPNGAAVVGLLLVAAGAGVVALAPLAAETVGEMPATGPTPTSPPVPPPAPAPTRPRRLPPEHRVRRPRPDPPDRTGA